jgi:hypothetical protein
VLRLIHTGLECGGKAFEGRPNHNFRCIAYVCYQQSTTVLFNEKNVEKEREVFNYLTLTPR